MSVSFGFIAAFITLFCWTVGTFSFTHASTLYAPKSINRVRLLFAAILLTILTCFIGDVSPVTLFTKPLAAHWLWLGISGVVGLSIGDHFAFTAFKIMGSSRTSLFNTFAPGAALLGGYFLLGESINLMGITGIAVSVSGIIWFIQANRKPREDNIQQQQLTQGLIYATLGALCQGFGLVFAKKGLMLDADYGKLMPLHATWIRMFSATVIIYGAGVFKTNLVVEFRAIAFSRTIMKPVLVGTLFGPVIGVSMSLYAASLIEVSLAQTIFSLLPISVILTAFILGKEKIEAKSLIAAVISVAGVFALVWREELLMMFR
ncbi:MAG: DMT family transporter [Bacteroidota bacterium]